MPNRPTRAPVALIALCLTLPSAAAVAEEAPADPMRAEPKCVEGRAIAETPEGLPLEVGPCGGEAPGVPAPTVPSAPAAGPADCLVPGFDDRCESWVAPRYDGPWSSADYPGFGSFDRHRTVLAHPTKDLVFVGGSSAYTNSGLPDSDFVNIAYRASTGQPVWTTTFEGLGDRTIAYQHSFALSPDGDRLYTIGRAAVPAVYIYATVIAAFDTATGRLLWARQAPISAEAIETAMTTLPDETVEERIYLGGVGGTTSPQGTTVLGGAAAALDPDGGATIWSVRFAGETPDGARFNEIVVSPDGSMVYAGGGEHGVSRLPMNLATVAYRAVDGERVWVSRDERTRPDHGSNGISDMGISGDGSRVLVTAFDTVPSNIIGTSSTSPILTVARDTATGEVAWRKTYGGPVDGETHFYFSLFQGMMAVSPDGKTAVVTASINSHNSTGTVAYDIVTGAQKWGVESVETGYVFTNYLGYYPTAQVNGDRAFVSNRRGIGYGQYQTVTTAYTLASGALEWTGRFGTNRALFGGNALTADGKRLVVSAAEQIFAAGGLAPNPNIDSIDIVTVSYDA